jgi:N-acyl homoserine lactone hydrolase
VNQYIIHPIPLCYGTRDTSQFTYQSGQGKPVDICCYTWYLDGPEKGILVDTGTTAEWYESHGRAGQKHIQYLEEGLGKFGIKPEDIRIVILTHLHVDHVEQARKFPRARFILQKKELDYVLNTPPSDTPGCDKQLLEGLEFETIEGDTEITEGIRTILTPGHTPGTQSVAIETKNGLAVISGFCAIKENFGNEAEGIPVSPPGMFTDLEEANVSLLTVKNSADICIPLHDMQYIDKASIPD